MNIAVAADGESLESQVSEKFELCLYILIVNMNDLTVTTIKTEELSGTSPEENLARKVLEYNCEAVITGNINQTALNILADAQVTRYFGVGHSVKDALELSENRLLNIIKEECEHHPWKGVKSL
ncbi:NifB/NifX family molybdenum-iron cluster-binding protein [Desulfosporosinus fructosivorans]